MRHTFTRARVFALVLCLAGASLTTACGSGGSTTNSVTNASAQSTTFNVGDAPLNGVLAFEVTINNITLTGTKGTVPVLTNPAKVEVSHLAGTFEPLTLSKIPADTYSQISVTFGAAELLFLPAGSSTPVHLDIAALGGPVNVALNPAVTVPQGVSSLNFDLKVANSLSIDAANNATFNPVFTLTSVSVAAGGQEEEESGELEDIKGILSVASANQFTITVGSSAQTMTFNTDATTAFDPSGTVLSSVPKGTVLEVDGITQADGSFLAKKVEIETENEIGLEAEGLVTQVSSPATSFQLVTHEATGAATVTPNLGSTVTVNLSSNTDFRVDGDGVSLSGMSFQFQSAADLASGQVVEADADTGNASSFTTKRIQLKQQALDGTIAGISNTGFQLTLDPNSTFARLTGLTTVNVFTANSENKTGANLANGQVVRVRGLLFFTAASGTNPASYNFVARRVQNP